MKIHALLLACLATWPAYAGSPPAPPAPPPGDIWWTSPTGVLTPIAYVPRTTWPTAPSIIAGTTQQDLVPNCSTAIGYVNRLGARVTADFTLNCTPTYTSATGIFKVTNLPYPAANGSITFGGIFSSPVTAFAWTAATGTMIQPSVGQGATAIAFNVYKSGAAGSALQLSAFPSGTAFR